MKLPSDIVRDDLENLQGDPANCFSAVKVDGKPSFAASILSKPEVRKSETSELPTTRPRARVNWGI
jgi:hypothetical protein